MTLRPKTDRDMFCVKLAPAIVVSCIQLTGNAQISDNNDVFTF